MSLTASVITLEISHSVLAEPFRIAASYIDIDRTTEAAQSVTFKASGLQSPRPTIDDSGNRNRDVTIPTVSGEVEQQVLAMLESGEPILGVFREFHLLNDELELGPDVMELSNFRFTDTAVQCTGGALPLLNRRTPRLFYTAENSPGLKL